MKTRKLKKETECEAFLDLAIDLKLSREGVLFLLKTNIICICSKQFLLYYKANFYTKFKICYSK